MKLFLDANILVSVLNIEYPIFTYSSKIISFTEDNKYEIWTSPVCLAIAFYFSEKKYGVYKASDKIKVLSKKLRITNINAATVLSVINNKSILDFEDGLQYYAALEHKCQYIITEDKNDFHFSKIPVMNSQSFIQMLFN